MKKYLIGFFVFFFLTNITLTSYGANSTCKYQSEIDQCIAAQSSGEAGPRSISDFVCISSRNTEKITTQIVLDKEFKKVDKEVEAYLSFLERSKDYYFGQNSQKNFLEVVDDIENKFSLTGTYGNKYMKFCNPSEKDSIVSQSLSCLGGVGTALNTSDFFTTEKCRNLVVTKLDVGKQVAYDMLKLNKNQIKKDYSKKYMQSQRNKYSKLIDIVMINIGYMERIWKKWPSKTRITK